MSDRRPQASPPGPGTASPARLSGYLLVAGAFVVFGAIGALVNYATAPESVLLGLRFGIAALALSAVYARPRTVAAWRQPGVPGRLLLMGALDAASQLCFFIALRETGVAVGMFLFYSGPMFVALLAPRFSRQTTDRAVWPSLTLAPVGLATILAPGLIGEGAHLSPLGVAAGVASAVLWALFMLVMKSLTRHLESGPIVLAECILDTAFLLPLALWQTLGTGYTITSHDLLSGVLLGVVCTAVTYLMFVEGLGRIRVQHASILGYLEPVSAPTVAQGAMRRSHALARDAKGRRFRYASSGRGACSGAAHAALCRELQASRHLPSLPARRERPAAG